MYPKLSGLINGLFGTHINLLIMSYGFFVSIAFLTGAYLLCLELKRKGNEALLKLVIKNIVVEKPASVPELPVNFVFSCKLAAVITDYRHFARYSQDFLFSGGGPVSAELIFADFICFMEV